MTKATDDVARLEAHLAGLGDIVVALSGGVDSSVVAVAAKHAVGARARAVTGVSASLAERERDDIRAFVRTHGIPHDEVETDELARPGYVENAPDRCFHCKDALFEALGAVARHAGAAVVVDGTHKGDLEGHRPGLVAAEKHGVRSPLLELGFDKDDVRAMARALGLANAERPSEPCLASRVAYGLAVDEERLAAVARAEDGVKALGFSRVRVRHHGEIARIEVPRAALGDAVARAAELVAAVKAAGFVYVTLDLAGLRSGSLLEVFEPRDVATPPTSPMRAGERPALRGRAADPSAPDVNAAMWPKKRP